MIYHVLKLIIALNAWSPPLTLLLSSLVFMLIFYVFFPYFIDEVVELIKVTSLITCSFKIVPLKAGKKGKQQKKKIIIKRKLFFRLGGWWFAFAGVAPSRGEEDKAPEGFIW